MFQKVDIVSRNDWNIVSTLLAKVQQCEIVSQQRDKEEDKLIIIKPITHVVENDEDAHWLKTCHLFGCVTCFL